jgi:hypothetical protein
MVMVVVKSRLVPMPMPVWVPRRAHTLHEKNSALVLHCVIMENGSCVVMTLLVVAALMVAVTVPAVG